MHDSEFRPLRNPGTGETYEFVVDEGPEGLLQMRWSLAAGGRVPEHVHPHGEERFRITSGQIRFWLNGRPRVAGAGETVVIPAGVRHRFRHGSGEVAAIVEVEPGGRMREFFEAVSGLSREGRSTRRAVPRNPLQLVVFADGFRSSFRTTSPPHAVQRLLLAALAPLARRLGYRETYPRYDARTGTV